MVARCGYYDPWVAHRGAKEVWVTGYGQWESGYDSLPYAGSASMAIDRIGDEMDFFWDGSPLVSRVCALPIEEVEVSFWYGVKSGGWGGPSFFGSESVDLISVAGTGPDCNDNGIPDECDIDCGEPGGECDVPGCGQSADCQPNGIPDECDIADGSSEDCQPNGVPDECDMADPGAGFCDVSSWATYDPGDHGVGNDPDGYADAVFDGRYVYFAPNYNGSEDSGEVLRYDTDGSFSGALSWTTFDAKAYPLEANGGYGDAVFDGRYVYFVPALYHGEVLRYDTAGGFADLSSWETFDTMTHPVEAKGGYSGGVFDGRYIYFVPYHNATIFHGEVLRYDTHGGFSNPLSWAMFDVKVSPVGAKGGYNDAIFDGRYVYFVPYSDSWGLVFHGEVLRYDTAGSFFAPSSWTTYDPGAHGVGDDPAGYVGAVFDGRYVYFAPLHNNTDYYGEVLRYDTTGEFSEVSFWAAYDPGANGVGNDPDGYTGAIFDGRYVYFAPCHNGNERHGEVLRHDTAGEFSEVSSWATYDAGDHGLGNDPDGYQEGVFDGRYVYFAPCHNGTEQHGEVLRYDTTTGWSPDCNANGIPDECDIADGTSQDCNSNGIPDECDIPPLCQAGELGYPDECSEDCQPNGIPDECELEGNDCNGNGVPDECDPDADGDGIPDDCDNCPDVPNPDQANSDGDSHGDACDNCPYDDNEDQADFDGDGTGDICDDDIDDDGVLNEDDVCDYTPSGTAVDPETGRPLGDIDKDCDTDLEDFALFQDGFTGPLP
ncbi:MAG: thrombospondin type 3 repeat-containing protein [Phycisphaerae bacterium]|nr:thrombospondin type 3 repeat-containing protein [Phycisphaerae bacterium]